MRQFQPSVAGTGSLSTSATNKMIKNTYSLLSLTLVFSAMMAGLSMFLQMPPMVNLITFGLSLVLLFFVLPKTANSSMGLLVVFAVTGLLGFGLGPMLNMYMGMANGGRIISTALGGTGIIFLGLSGYALTTKKDFSFLGGFLITGFLVVIMAALANIFMQIPALSLAISGAVIMIMSGFILFDTSRIVNGGETNYIMATISLYLSILNIFVSLLHILGVFGGDD